MKPGFSVSTINPSKSKTSAASIILIKTEIPSEIRGDRTIPQRLLIQPIEQFALTFAADFEEIRIGKKAFQLQGSVLEAVRPVDHIDHGVFAEIAADCSWR